MLHLLFSRQSQTAAIALFALLATGCQQANSASTLPIEGTTPANSAALSNANNPLANAAGLIPSSSPQASAPAPAPQSPAPQAPAPQAPAPQSPAPQAPAPIAQSPAPEANGNEWAYEDRITGPEQGILEAVDAGDERCYLSVKTKDGSMTHTLGATFVVCNDQYLDQEVKLTYERLRSLSCSDTTNDCFEVAVTKIEPVTDALHPRRAGEAVYTEYRNEERSILVTSAEPWSGENETGNFTYRGCDLETNQCDEATGGKASCNDYKCLIVWDGPAQHSISEDRVDSEAIANYIFIWNHHHVAINEYLDRHGEAFF